MFQRRNARMSRSMFRGRNVGSFRAQSAPRTPSTSRSRSPRRCARRCPVRSASRSPGRSTRMCRGIWTRRSVPAPSPPLTGEGQAMTPLLLATTPLSLATTHQLQVMRLPLPVTRLQHPGEVYKYQKYNIRCQSHKSSRKICLLF